MNRDAVTGLQQLVILLEDRGIDVHDIAEETHVRKVVGTTSAGYGALRRVGEFQDDSHWVKTDVQPAVCLQEARENDGQNFLSAWGSCSFMYPLRKPDDTFADVKPAGTVPPRG